MPLFLDCLPFGELDFLQLLKKQLVQERSLRSFTDGLPRVAEIERQTFEGF